MTDVKPIIAKNISALRQARGMTQLELAEMLNYSDKAVSKWERAESMPDIAVLVEIADLFDVTLDYLVRAEHKDSEIRAAMSPEPKYSRGFVAGISILLVWFVALSVFVLVSLITGSPGVQWLSFVWAIPISTVVWLVFNSIWFNKRRNYLIISLMMWSLLASVQLSLLPVGMNLWLIYLPGIPGQVMILMWSRLRKKAPVDGDTPE